MIIIDKLSYSSGLAHVSPEEKFAYAVLTLLVCVVSRSVAAAVTVLAVNGILNVKKGRVPFYLYLKYLMVPLIFLLLSTLAILVNVSKEPLDAYAIPLGQYYVTSSWMGQKKQVSIADILVMRPEIIILDEPAAALDPKHTRMVNEMVDKLTEQGITVLMATHDMDYAYAWADEIVLMKDGKVLCQGAPEAVCRETEKLKETNLEEPALLRLFDRLKARKIIEATGKAPRTWKELEQLIG